MKLLITGICGFVGSSLAVSLLEAMPGLELSGIDNFMRPGSEENRRRLTKMGVKLIHADIRCASDFESLAAVDWVIDAAANPSVLAGVDGQTSSRQLIEHNFFGTINILEYCKRHGTGLILISTSRVYSIAELAKIKVAVCGDAFCLRQEQCLTTGLSAAGVNEAFSTDPPISLYGCSKLASEMMALEYGETFGFPVWINRCGLLSGAGQFGRADQGIVAFWINSYLHRLSLRYIGFGGKGYQVRDCLHPRDLARFLEIQLTTQPQTGVRVFNIGGGCSNMFSLAELSNWCADRFGYHQILENPQERHFDLPWLVMDSSTAQNCLGWQPVISLSEIWDEVASHAEQNLNWLEISGAV